MPPPDSGSDGESSEKPVRERLKQTSIDKNAVNAERRGPQASLEAVEELSDTSPEMMQDAANPNAQSVSKHAQKRTLEADNPTEPDDHGDGSESQNLHSRKRTRDDQARREEGLEKSSGGSQNGEGTDARLAGRTTPPLNTDSDRLEATLTSPRKKRSRESLDGDENIRSQKIQSTEGTRARRSSSEERRDTTNNVASSKNSGSQSDSKPTFGETLKPKSVEKPSDKPQTSSSAFAASGFASLSGSASPFGSLGSPSSKASEVSSQPTFSSFASPAASQQPTFGSSFGGSQSSFASTAKAGTSGFGRLGSQTFGGGSGGFSGSAFGAGPRLSSFAAPVGDAKLGTAKAEKPFGAPAESEDESEGGSDSAEDGTGEEAAPKERKDENTLSPKFQVQEVQTGEDDEDSVYSNRAKLFQYHNDSSSWKERGVGPLKVNVKRTPASSSSNADAGEDGDSPSEQSEPQVNARLIMRNHATHKVILNAPIFKEMKVNEQSGKQLLFACPNETGAMSTYMLRMGKEDDIKQLHRVVNDLKGRM